jgi:hypothetical protein
MSSMRTVMLWTILLASAPAGATLPPPPPEGVEVGIPAAVDPAAPAPGRTLVEFGDDLLIDGGVMMQGITAISTVPFRLHPSWRLNSDPVLHLRYDHSRALLPKRSTLSVWLNGVSVGSTMLDLSDADDGQLEVRLPRRMLAESGYNELQFKVVQHSSDECEDPFDPALWTRLSVQSTIELDRELPRVKGQLEHFPSPFFDDMGYGPFAVALGGLGADVSGPTLEALGLLGFAFGRHGDYRGVDVNLAGSDPDLVEGHLLVVGTPAENALVSRYVQAETLKAGVGTVVMVPNPARPTQAVLVVTGGDAEGVLKAAEALASEDRAELLSGTRSDIPVIERAVPAASRRLPKPLPAIQSAQTQRLTIDELGLPDRTVRGYYAPPVQIPLTMEGDSEVHIDGARIGVDYAYGALVDTRLSTIEVRLGDVTLRSAALNEVDGEERTRLWVDLPYELLRPDSKVEVVFHLFPKDMGECVYVTDRHLWGTVFSSTELVVSRDRFAEVPDLGRMRYDLWPLSTAMGDEGLLVVTEDQPGPDDAAAVMQLMGELGQRNVLRSPSFQVVRGSANAATEAGGRDMILLIGEGRSAAYENLQKVATVTATREDVARRLKEGGDSVLAAQVGNAYGTLEQVVVKDGASPRLAMVLDATTDRALLPMVKLLGDPSVTGGFSGNVAIIGEDGGVHALDAVSDKTSVGNRSLSSQVKRSINRSWGLLGLGVLLASVLLAYLVRGWAARRGGHA